MFNTQFNAGESRARLRAAREAIEDLTPIHAEIGEYMIRATRKRFVQGVSPTGAKWAAKSATTIARYKKLGYGGLALSRTLRLSGRLGNEIQSIPSSRGVLIGSSLIYSGVMQDGAARGAFGRTSRNGPIPWGRIPARVWLGLSAENDAAIVAIVDQAIAAKLGPSTSSG